MKIISLFSRNILSRVLLLGLAVGLSTACVNDIIKEASNADWRVQPPAGWELPILHTDLSVQKVVDAIGIPVDISTLELALPATTDVALPYSGSFGPFTENDRRIDFSDSNFAMRLLVHNHFPVALKVEKVVFSRDGAVLHTLEISGDRIIEAAERDSNGYVQKTNTDSLTADLPASLLNELKKGADVELQLRLLAPAQGKATLRSTDGAKIHFIVICK